MAVAWFDEALRGAVGLALFGALFGAARLRFSREQRRGGGDVGLD